MTHCTKLNLKFGDLICCVKCSIGMENNADPDQTVSDRSRQVCYYPLCSG